MSRAYRVNGKPVKCPDCGTTDSSKFYRRKDVKTPGLVAHSTRCRNCQNKVEKTNRAMRRYGMTLKQYNQKLSEPCSICGGKSEVMDHCHETGKVRDSLCHACNIGIGKFRDCPELVSQALNYLKRHK